MKRGARPQIEIDEESDFAAAGWTAGEQLVAVRPVGWRPRLRLIITYAVPAAVALGVTLSILFALGASPGEVLSTIGQSAFGSKVGLSLVINKFTPLLLGSAGIAFAMRAGFVNLGVDGQMYVGAVFAVGVAFLLDGAPGPVLVAAVLVASVVGGGMFALIAATLRQRWGVNELFTTVMLNFVGFYLADWLAAGPWTDPIAGEAVTRRIPDAALLPRMFERIHIGPLIAVPIAIGLTWLLFRTRQGFNMRAVGLNRRGALFGGVNVAKVTFLAFGVSGMVAGLAGAIEVTGVHGMMPSGLSPNYGYISVLIAVLSRRNPMIAVAMAFLFGILIVGGDSLQGTVGLPASAVLMFQALIVLSVLYVDARRGSLSLPQSVSRGGRR